jgi:hypothetical protein
VRRQRGSGEGARRRRGSGANGGSGRGIARHGGKVSMTVARIGLGRG